MMILATYNKTNVSGMDIDQAMFFYSFPDRETEDNIMNYLRDNENIYNKYNYFECEILNNCFILNTTRGFKWLKQFIENIERIANGKKPINIKIEPPIKVDEKKKENKGPKYTSRVVYDEDERRMHIYFGTSPKEEVARILFGKYFDSIVIKNPDYEILVDGRLIKKLYWEITIISYTQLPIDDKDLLNTIIEEVFDFMGFKACVYIDSDDQIMIEKGPKTVSELYYQSHIILNALHDINNLDHDDKNDVDDYLMDLEDIIDELSDLAREKK